MLEACALNEQRSISIHGEVLRRSYEAVNPEAFSRTAITCQGGRWVPIAPPQG
jgi:hypothetical protein